MKRLPLFLAFIIMCCLVTIVVLIISIPLIIIWLLGGRAPVSIITSINNILFNSIF